MNNEDRVLPVYVIAYNRKEEDIDDPKNLEYLGLPIYNDRGEFLLSKKIKDATFFYDEEYTLHYIEAHFDEIKDTIQNFSINNLRVVEVDRDSLEIRRILDVKRDLDKNVSTKDEKTVSSDTTKKFNILCFANKMFYKKINSIGGDDYFWVKNHSQATFFDTKEDAEKVIEDKHLVDATVLENEIAGDSDTVNKIIQEHQDELARIASEEIPISKDYFKQTNDENNEELHPDRYGSDTLYECKKVLEEWFRNNPNINGYEGFLLSTIIKYCNRFGKKDDKLKEAKKIEVYARFLREFEER